jgi:hypothetical protein
LFHYTDRRGAEAIRASRKLKKSERVNGDASEGNGVYFTKKSPRRHSKVDIAMNNWGGSRARAEMNVRCGKADYVVMVLIPDYNPRIKDRSKKGRDVWVYADSDVNLDDFEFEIRTFEESGKPHRSLNTEPLVPGMVYRCRQRVRIEVRTVPSFLAVRSRLRSSDGEAALQSAFLGMTIMMERMTMASRRDPNCIFFEF